MEFLIVLFPLPPFYKHLPNLVIALNVTQSPLEEEEESP